MCSVKSDLEVANAKLYWIQSSTEEADFLFGFLFVDLFSHMAVCVELHSLKAVHTLCPTGQ